MKVEKNLRSVIFYNPFGTTSSLTLFVSQERMFKEMAIDYENEDNDKNESMYQVGDGEQFNYKCYPMNEDWRYGLDKDRDVEIVEPDISDFDPKYVKEYLKPSIQSNPVPSPSVDDQWFEDWEDIFNLDDMDDFI